MKHLRPTFTREWLDQQAAMIPILAAAQRDSLYSDHATADLDSLTRAARIESYKLGVATKVAMVTLIPSILLCGIIAGTLLFAN